MKIVAPQLTPYFSRTTLKLIWQVLSSQILFQIMGFGISIILIRQMPKEDYAIYTILISIQAILTMLSDSGISIGFQAIGGKVWDNPQKLASLIRTASYIRWRIISFAFIVIAVYSVIILTRQHISTLQIIFFLTSLLLIVSPEIQKGFLQHALLLQKDVLTVQLTSVLNQGIRLFLICLVFLLLKNYLTIQIVLCITIASIWISFIFLLKKSKYIFSHPRVIDSEYKQTLLYYLKVNWHNTAFYAFQGQISVFLIGIFGSTTNLASLGALTRYSMIFIAISALVSNILSPAFGRCRDKSKLVWLYAMSWIALVGLSVVILGVVYLFPVPFLWILGSQYQNLSYELLLVFISGLISLISSSIFALNAAKGWIKFSPIWEIPANIIALTTGIFIFNISSLQGVLYLSILSALPTLLLYVVNSLVGFKRL